MCYWERKSENKLLRSSLFQKYPAGTDVSMLWAKHIINDRQWAQLKHLHRDNIVCIALSVIEAGSDGICSGIDWTYRMTYACGHQTKKTILREFREWAKENLAPDIKILF
jgi:hypothetical protein